MSEPRGELELLERRLERLSTAMRTPAAGATGVPWKPQEPPGAPAGRNLPRGGLALAVALVAVAVATGQLWLLLPALLLAGVSAALMTRTVSDAMGAMLPSAPGTRDPTRAHIGMGATVGAGAVIEPGASVEMGATVREGAVIKRGAVVRSGATVGAAAVVEEVAVVSWGADVKGGARVRTGAIVGAGSTVHEGAEVPAGMRLLPGSDWARGEPKPGIAPAPAAPPALAPEADPRAARLEAICDRLDRELRQAPENVRAFLGASDDTGRALRDTCRALLAREQALRAESSAETLAFLEKEERELERRAREATDDRVRASLRSAVTAIGEQLRQRRALATQADRMAAELTRLEWTLDGLATQWVRLRTAGQQAGTDPAAEVLGTVRQLNEELDALAQAMEEVGASPVDAGVAGGERPSAPGTSARER